MLLQTALEALDRMRDCQRAIAADGLTVKDRFDKPKPHPLLVTERDARSQMLLALKQLNLDIAPDRPLGAHPRVDQNAPAGSSSKGSTPTLRRVF